MTATTDQLAEMSKEAYSHDRARQIGSYLFDHELSDPETAVYHDPATKHSVLAARGTQLGAGGKTALKDVRTDLGIVTGLDRAFGLGKRVDQAEQVFKRIQGKYGGRVAATGHSLGGAIAAKLAGRNADVDRVETFNLGVGLPSFSDLRCSKLNIFGKPAFCNKIVNNRTFGDPVSLLSRLGVGSGSWRTLTGKGVNRHTIDQFAP